MRIYKSKRRASLDGITIGELKHLAQNNKKEFEWLAPIKSDSELVQDFMLHYRLWLNEKEARPCPPSDRLRHHLQTHCPVLYARVLADTLADLRQEHFDAVAASRPLQARWVLLRGCGAMAVAAAYQLGYSLLGRIAEIWQTRSLK